MDHGKLTPEPLDATGLIQLRQRFSEIAARRVPESAVDDVVQDALGIVLAKGGTQPDLRWSFAVLRNVIGNYYQKRRHHDSLEAVEVADDRPDALAALTTDERHRTIRTAVDELRLDRPDCAAWLWSLAQGTKAGELAARAQLDRDAFYRKIYRCRQQLAAILRRKGVTA
jgi:DNA-directed RNA polymerase specialized sigma24 family protein